MTAVPSAEVCAMSARSRYDHVLKGLCTAGPYRSAVRFDRVDQPTAGNSLQCLPGDGCTLPVDDKSPCLAVFQLKSHLIRDEHRAQRHDDSPAHSTPK